MQTANLEPHKKIRTKTITDLYTIEVFLKGRFFQNKFY
ncbi:hypothetical protein LEP1GSC170_3259 [Leptospira interrogans serovar Bataviae str. HAI135]|nr:hypothetical protein LEP1GSC170_3259 [Leptospira interrogans serovar Bataviae str. HAI135]